jgi:ABC-type Fe3+-hydroxamate transport system substrate-binding protein
MLTFAACAPQTSTQQAVPPPGGADPSGVTVTDAGGNILKVPAPDSKPRIASAYAVSTPFIVALGLSDDVVAINVRSKFWTDAVPALDKAGTVGRGSVDYEKLATYGATALIHRANDPQTAAGAARIGVPTIEISVESLDDIMSTLDLLGAYFHKEERAAEVKDWTVKKFKKIDSIVSKIPENKRESAICFGSSLGRIAGGDMLQSWMIEKAGGIPSAADVENNSQWADVGAERIFAMNPDVIFLTSSTVLQYDVATLKTSENWSEVKAARTGRIYTVPAKLDSWDLPGIACTIGTFYMLHEMYPEHFSAESLQKEVDSYYKFIFGKTFTKTTLGE